jgi:hypothetical protein
MSIRDEFEGRRRWHDMSCAQRADSLRDIVDIASSGASEREKSFAKGWLDAHRAKRCGLDECDGRCGDSARDWYTPDDPLDGLDRLLTEYREKWGW